MGYRPPRPPPPRIEIVRHGFFRTTIRPGPPPMPRQMQAAYNAACRGDHVAGTRRISLVSLNPAIVSEEEPVEEEIGNLGESPSKTCPPWREPLPSEMR